MKQNNDVKKELENLSKPQGRKYGTLQLALIIPMLLIFVLGMLEVGRMMLFYTAAATASHAAAKYGAAVDMDGSGIVPHHQDCEGIRDEAMRVKDAFFILEDAYITIQYDRGPGTAFYAACAPDPAKVQPGDRIVVQFVAPYEPVVPFGFRAFDVLAEARYVIDTAHVLADGYEALSEAQK